MLEMILSSRNKGKLPGSHMSSAISQAVMSIILSIPWLVAYFVVFAGVDPSQCAGVPYAYANFARWAYLGGTIGEVVILLPLKLRVAKKRDEGDESRAHCLFTLLDFLSTCFGFGIWIYACVALSHQGDCQANSVVSLLWATVICPVAVVGLGLVFYCCIGVCFGKLVKDLASQSKNNDLQSQGQAERELERAMKDLEKNLKNLGIPAAVLNQK